MAAGWARAIWICWVSRVMWSLRGPAGFSRSRGSGCVFQSPNSRPITSLSRGQSIAPATPRKGTIQNEYDWLVLGRRASEFPTRDYKVPTQGKIPFDFTKIEPQAKFLNSELDSASAIMHAKDEVEENQRFLLKQEVDQVTKFDTTFNVEKPTYLHAPLWFIQYEYKGKSYNAIIDGSSASIIRADIPQTDFKMI